MAGVRHTLCRSICTIAPIVKDNLDKRLYKVAISKVIEAWRMTGVI
jgi:hypothetical protein